MNRFTVEETNLLSIYHEGKQGELIENMIAALPYMDAGLRSLQKRTLSKEDALDRSRLQVSLPFILLMKYDLHYRVVATKPCGNTREKGSAATARMATVFY